MFGHKVFVFSLFRLDHFYWTFFNVTDPSVMSILLVSPSAEFSVLVITVFTPKVSIWFFSLFVETPPPFFSEASALTYFWGGLL